MNRRTFVLVLAVLFAIGIGMRIAHGMGPFYEVGQAIELYSDPSSRANLTSSPVASAASGYLALGFAAVSVVIVGGLIRGRRDGGGDP